MANGQGNHRDSLQMCFDGNSFLNHSFAKIGYVSLIINKIVLYFWSTVRGLNCLQICFWVVTQVIVSLHIALKLFLTSISTDH